MIPQLLCEPIRAAGWSWKLFGLAFARLLAALTLSVVRKPDLPTTPLGGRRERIDDRLREESAAEGAWQNQ